MKHRGLLVFLLACVMVFTLALPVGSLAQDDLKVITSVLQIDAATQDRVLTHINETLQDNRWNTLIAVRLGYNRILLGCQRFRAVQPEVQRRAGGCRHPGYHAAGQGEDGPVRGSRLAGGDGLAD